MADLRFSQLEQDYADEVAETNTKFAFAGFGRSGIRLDDVLRVGEKNAERTRKLDEIIQLEQQIAQYELLRAEDQPSWLKSLRETLSQKNKEASQLASQAQQRVGALRQEVMSVGQMVDRLSRRTFQGPLFRRAKAFALKIKPILPTSTKPFAPSSLTGLKVPSFGAKFNLGRVRPFGSF